MKGFVGQFLMPQQQGRGPLAAWGADSKETTLGRADLIFQLLMFVTTVKGREIFIIFFFSSFLSAVVPAISS